VSHALRILQLNLAYDPTLTTPESLLHTYHTLTGWSTALTRAGAEVHVVQRFSSDTRATRDGVPYEFVRDGAAGLPKPWARLDRIRDAVIRLRADIVHINGLMFPGMVASLRDGLPRSTAIVLQDHSGALPKQLPFPVPRLSPSRWRRAFEATDACVFTARALAERWYPLGLPPTLPLIELPEASTWLVASDRNAARRASGIDASPAILWVGRLDRNKDPLTALGGLERALPRLPAARCWMIFHAGDLEPVVRRRVARSHVLRDRVTLVGRVAHDRMADYYSAADVFLSASRHEGSGYALIESIACGVSPCVADIAAFRALMGDCGARFPVGDPSACAEALVRVGARDREAERTALRRHFAEHLSWDVVGQRALAAYRTLASKRAGSR
jgi:glycosyltransferase involved in cell wall biosynthesis